MGIFDGLKYFFGGKAAGPKKAVFKKRAKMSIIDVAKRFDLRNRSGQGSMSKVWNAYDNKLGRMVCLKVLDKEKTKKFEERFSSQGLSKPGEGEICMELRHENCVQTYEYGITTDREPCLVMEWIDGMGLNYLIETNSPQLKGNRVNFLIQLCKALEYLHTQKYLHRDLCPRNVMVSKDNVVKLIDFGLTIPYTPDYCRPGNRTGTADYLAPEIIKRQSTDHRVDIFALGITAYEIFTGQMPWERAMSSEETLRRHLNVPPREPKEINKNLDDDISKILIQAIARNPAERFASAKAMREALESLERTDY
ncbi:serine/threonine protein kinase [Zavarzinella formosa]|uniref:serine/threonine protein kinase n=1 Tax=Zavarzinella formosa TaxID=360055 RepID=UPI0002F42307|nr:serine/threonine-protein kinase [Zavarzinella formosa]